MSSDLPPAPPQNPLHERYASREMAAVFSERNRYGQWRRIWIALAEAQMELGLPIAAAQIAALRKVAGEIDFERVAEIERQTRHDVVAHLRHFAERAPTAGGILHLGATSAFVTDNTDVLLIREALRLVELRLVTVITELSAFAERHAALPTLAYTHLQPAQLTTVGKRACLWLQDFLDDLEEVRHRLRRLRCRGAKGTTGTQASYLQLFDGDHAKVIELDRLVSEKLGFTERYPITGQTYPRKQDSQVLAALAGTAESAHKFGTDLRLLQGFGELAEGFGAKQVGSSAMPYKRNPIRSERMCALARRLLTDSLNGPLTASTQWLERSLDDSANRRLVLPDAFLTADAVLTVAAHLASGLTVREEAIAARVRRELPFMVVENLMMEATARGGDRQQLHERLRGLSLEAHQAVARGEENPLFDRLAAEPDFPLSAAELCAIEPASLTGRAARQVAEFLSDHVRPALAGSRTFEVEEPRV